MTVVKIILLLLKITGALMDYAEKKGLINEATWKEIYRTMDRLNARRKKAQEARDNSIANSESGGLSDDDGYRLD